MAKGSGICALVSSLKSLFWVSSKTHIFSRERGLFCVQSVIYRFIAAGRWRCRRYTFTFTVVQQLHLFHSVRHARCCDNCADMSVAVRSGYPLHVLYAAGQWDWFFALGWGLQPMEAERESKAGWDRQRQPLLSLCRPLLGWSLLGWSQYPYWDDLSRDRGGMLVMMTNTVNSNYDDFYSSFVFTFTRHHRIYALTQDRILGPLLGVGKLLPSP